MFHESTFPVTVPGLLGRDNCACDDLVTVAGVGYYNNRLQTSPERNEIF
jgi:hypothetical protein